MMGVTFEFGGKTLAPWISVTVLLLTAVAFIILTWLRMSRKRK